MKNTYHVIVSLALLIIGSAEAKLPRLTRNEIAHKVDCRDEICVGMVKRHLIRDLKGCQIDPESVANTPQLAGAAGINEVRVHGRSAFLGFVPAPYRYHMTLTPSGGVLIQANVYFTNHAKLDADTMNSMQEKLDLAAAKWTQYNPYGFPLQFKFVLTTKRSEADVKAKLLVGKYTRGPYFSFWTTEWSSDIISHEMGHVMGLDDEYSNTPFPGLTRCDRESIMCIWDRPFPYHYYLITRRMLCTL